MTEEYKLQNGEGGCFACVNSGQGFRSYFDTFLGKMQYVYVIKGGPGTGKSGFMRRIRKEAQKRKVCRFSVPPIRNPWTD